MKERAMTVPVRLLASAAALLFSTGLAAAAPAVADSDLNVRSGPGTQYAVIGVIPAGTAVNATGCSGSWCRVRHGGDAGWASSAYLDIGGGAAGPVAVDEGPAVVEEDQDYPAVVEADPGYDGGYGYDDGYYAAPAVGFGGGFVIGSGGHRHFRNGDNGRGYRGRGNAYNGGGGRQFAVRPGAANATVGGGSRGPMGHSGGSMAFRPGASHVGGTGGGMMSHGGGMGRGGGGMVSHGGGMGRGGGGMMSRSGGGGGRAGGGGHHRS